MTSYCHAAFSLFDVPWDVDGILLPRTMVRYNSVLPGIVIQWYTVEGKIGTVAAYLVCV